MERRRNRPRWVSVSCIPLLPIWIAALLLLSAVGVSGQVLTLTPSLSVGERYDDNIFEDPSNEEDDFVTVVTPSIQLRYMPTSDTELNFKYRPSFEIYADHSDENQVTQRVLLRFASPLTRLFSLSVQDTLTITEEPGDRILEIDQETGLRTTSREDRGQTIRNSASVSLQVRLAPRSSFGLLFDSLLDDVDVENELDEFRYTIGGQLGYLVNVGRGNRVYVSSDVTFHQFSENGLALPNDEDFRVHTINVGYQHAFSRTLSGDVTIGYSITKSDDPDFDDNSAVIGSIRLTKTLRTGQVSLSYRRYFTSGGDKGGVVLADTFVASISTKISPKVTAGLGGNLSLFNFEEPNDDEDRLFFIIRPSLSYQILRFWLLSVDYDFAVTNYDESNVADETNHRLSFVSRFTLRRGWFLSLTYRYRARQFDDPRSRDEFDRNIIELTLAYAPTFRF
jgi:hypothetical protein